MVEADVSGVSLYRRGKVRDTFDVGDGTLLMVSTDRVSAFDVVLPTPIPGKGRVLTQMSRWWFEKTVHFAPNHLRPDAPETLPATVDWETLHERTMRVARADRIDLECVVRGYLAGSGWKEYRESGTLAGETLSAGLLESSKLPEPRFTPAVKNDSGHDENISRQMLAKSVGSDLARRLEDASVQLYEFAVKQSAARNVIIADTKFEFGVVDGVLTLIDEVFTPDSSRFWAAEDWRPGRVMPSFDKQPLRDWLESLDWDKTPPGPRLPDEIVTQTSNRYREAARRVCGLDVR